MKTVRVLIVDDYALVRAGIRAVLRSEPSIEIVGEAAGGREALAFLARVETEIVLLDMSMPEMDGMEVAARIANDHPEVRVIILSIHHDVHRVRESVRLGVAGYVLKEFPGEIAPAILAAAGGGTHFSDGLARYLTPADPQPAPAELPVDVLPPRQREILKLIAEGYSTKEISQQLNISIKTTETHRTRLMNRLDLHDIAGLVRYAIRNGLITSEK